MIEVEENGQMVEKPMYLTVGTHTARRGFVTMLMRKATPTKNIMEMTGHKSLQTFLKYYKIEQNETKSFMDSTFDMEFKAMKKA